MDAAKKKNLEATASVAEHKKKLETLKSEKEAFLLTKGVKTNKFDSFFEGTECKQLRENATLGGEAKELIARLASLGRIAGPTIDLVSEDADLEEPEEMDEDAMDEFLTSEYDAMKATGKFEKEISMASAKGAGPKVVGKTSAGKWSIMTRGKGKKEKAAGATGTK